MAFTSRERNMVIGIVAVAVIVAIAGAFLLGRGSGDEKGTTTAATTPTQTTQTQTQADTVVKTVTDVEPPPPSSDVTIVEQSVNPVTPGKNTPVLCTVRTTGDAAMAKIDITGKAGFLVDLNKGPMVNGVTIWTQTVAAPNLAGPYKYNAIVTGADGKVTQGPSTPFTVTP